MTTMLSPKLYRLASTYTAKAVADHLKAQWYRADFETPYFVYTNAGNDAVMLAIAASTQTQQ